MNIICWIPIKFLLSISAWRCWDLTHPPDLTEADESFRSLELHGSLEAVSFADRDPDTAGDDIAVDSAVPWRRW